ncbi:hypothetical protein KBTX_04307 [wastewater metagenome]|uniref:Uncharacterized protein n=2 Tax=unclassified sequences TaxID=12908 RepID=A0A5B8RH28_9ZZZZ|nr:hypothetical protein KBTEX_04307 [uncultured organism]
MFAQRLHELRLRFRGDVLRGQHVPDQGLEVGALAQRRQAHTQAVEAVVEVRAECTVGHALCEVPVRGRDQGEIHRFLVAAAHRHDTLLLKHAEKPGLQCLGHLADLVEEQGPAVRLVHPAPGALATGAGECPGGIPE